MQLRNFVASVMFIRSVMLLNFLKENIRRNNILFLGKLSSTSLGENSADHEDGHEN